MQNELTTLLNNLSGETKIGLHSFSTPGGKNNKIWGPSTNKLVTIGEPGMRDLAIAFASHLMMKLIQAIGEVQSHGMRFRLPSMMTK